MYKAKKTFLWFQVGEEVSEPLANWIAEGLVEETSSEPVEKELSEEEATRVEEIIEDLKDDGKLNYSNNPKKKSPGRKKKGLFGKKK